MNEWDKAKLSWDQKTLIAVGDEMNATIKIQDEQLLQESLKMEETEELLQLANSRCNELAKQLGETQDEVRFYRSECGVAVKRANKAESMNKTLNEYAETFGWFEASIMKKKLEAIRELCKNTLRINRGLPITTLEDGYLMDSDSLSQRILEVLGVLKEMQKEEKQ